MTQPPRFLTIRLLLALPTLLAVASAQGHELFTENDLLADIPRVSAVSRFEQRLEEAPASVTIVSRELIEMSGAQTFVDIFHLVPGFQAYHVNNNRFGISYHGIGREFPNQIEVMVDGRSVYETLFSSVNWSTLGIALEDIDHIEVVRGSNAPAQGSNAFFGSINIITRKPVQEEGTTVRLGAGDTRLRRVTLTNSGRAGEADYRLSLGHDHNAGFPAVPEGPLEDGRELTWGNLRATFTPTVANTLDVALGHAHERIGWGDSDHPDEFSNAHTFANFQSLTWTHSRDGDNEFEVQAYHNSFKITNFQDLGPLYGLLDIDDATAAFLTAETPEPAHIVALFAQATGLEQGPAAAILEELNTGVFGGFGRLASERYDIQAQHSFATGTRLRGAWGLGVRHDSLETTHPQSFPQDISETYLRLFSNNQWQVTRQLTLNLGALLEDTHVGTLFSPRLAANYLWRDGQAFRAAYARGNRAPSLLESNEVSVTKVGDVVVDMLRFADPDLAEETMDSYELAYLYQNPDRGLALDVRLFREEVRDVIDEARELSPPEVEIFGDRTYKRLVNRDYWEFNGGEIQVQFQISPATFLRLHYTAMDFDPDIAPETPPFPQVYKDDRVAKRSGGFVIGHSFSPHWSAALTGFHQSGLRWEDGDTMDSINRLDAQVTYQFRVGTTHGKIRLIAQNLGDTYSEFNGNNLFKTRFFVNAQLDFP